MSQTVSEVLVAEDVQSVREMLRVTLEGAGYHVFEAADGRSAQRMLRGSPCPLVAILDADLPGLGAEAILARLAGDAALARHAYVFLTGTQPEQLPTSLRQLLSEFDVAVLRMPFTTEALMDVVGRAALRPMDTAAHQSSDVHPASRPA